MRFAVCVLRDFIVRAVVKHILPKFVPSSYSFPLHALMYRCNVTLGKIEKVEAKADTMNGLGMMKL